MPEAQEIAKQKPLEKGCSPEKIPNILKEFERKYREEDRNLQKRMKAAGITFEDIIKSEGRSLKEVVEDARLRVDLECSSFLPLLEERVGIFGKKYPNEAAVSSFSQKSYPAVDLASGSSLGTVALALTTLNPDYFPINKNKPGLYWYPSEIVSNESGQGLERTRQNLMYQLSEEPLFKDGNNKPVFELDIIELNGLNTVSFNGRNGEIKGPDPKKAGRYGVRLAPENKEISFKKENIFFFCSQTLYGAILHSLQEKEMAKVFYQDLLDRVREIDVLRKDTWSNVEELYGKCAFVTCTHLLTQIGYREPSAWRNTMELAAQILHVDGYLLQYDTVGYDQFGDTSSMQEFAKTLDMELDFVKNGTVHENSRRMRKVIIWKKK